MFFVVASNELRGDQLRKGVHPYVKFQCRNNSKLVKCSASLVLAYFKKGEAQPTWVKREDAATGWYVKYISQKHSCFITSEDVKRVSVVTSTLPIAKKPVKDKALKQRTLTSLGVRRRVRGAEFDANCSQFDRNDHSRDRDQLRRRMAESDIGALRYVTSITPCEGVGGSDGIPGSHRPRSTDVEPPLNSELDDCSDSELDDRSDGCDGDVHDEHFEGARMMFDESAASDGDAAATECDERRSDDACRSGGGGIASVTGGG